MAVKETKKKKEKKNITSGVAHVNSTFNNTIITITDHQGNTVSWSSAGTQGFKGSRKSTPFAAQLAAEDAGKKAQDHGLEKALDNKLIELSQPALKSGRKVSITQEIYQNREISPLTNKTLRRLSMPP